MRCFGCLTEANPQRWRAGRQRSRRGELKQLSACPPELKDIVREANEQPFASILEQAAKRKLPEASCCSYLPEDRLDGGFSSSVGLPTSLGFEDSSHRDAGLAAMLR